MLYSDLQMVRPLIPVTYVVLILLVAIIAWLSLHLSKQKKTDFKPRNDDLSFARDNTEPCVACCATLERVRDAAKENLSGKNLEVFLTEIGAAFHGYAHSNHEAIFILTDDRCPDFYWNICGNFQSVPLAV